MSDKIIKSKARVRDFGEVFTQPREVNAMLDMVEDAIKQIDSSFLEPSCGTGNFLVEILKRKMEYHCKPNDEIDEYQQKIITILHGIFGIEIQRDNVTECRQRLFIMIVDNYLNRFLDVDRNFYYTITNILKMQIVCGNFLTKEDSTGEKIWFL
jgi:type I restriction-modification system DNA methylase subunit